ncbi:MAG: HD domain-containing protein, partial [Mariprofundaceae bacterium]|nr:HD domain-containing protein [Mariprofundaceae bacterium]
MLTLETARQWYDKDPTHGFGHIVRVYRLAENLAQAEGADLEIVRAAALLHDAHDAAARDAAGRAGHHLASALFARRILQAEGWPAERIAAVEHCIRAHRFRDASEQPQTPEAQCLFDADKLDAIGAIGVARAIAYAVTHNAPIYAPPSMQFLQSGQRQPDEPHSAWHEYWFKLRHLPGRLFTASGRSEER